MTTAKKAGICAPVRCVKPCAAWRFASTAAQRGRVTSIRGNRDDVWSHGHLCPKGASLAALHDDPDRIRRPMIKVDGRWQEVSWDAAFRRCTELLTPVIRKYGIGAVTAYTGNPLAHYFSLARYAGVLLGMSGMPVIYSPGTVDQWPKNLSSHLMYGGWWNFPVPDIERTDLLVIMGANPAASQGSLLAAPDVMGLIDAIRKRGKVIVIDPVRTGTAAQRRRVAADRPGHRRGAAAGRRAHALRRGPGRSRTARRRRRHDAPGRRGLAAEPGERRHRYRRRPHPPAGPRARRHPRNRWSTGGSACATRSSAPSPAGWSTSSTS